MYGSNLHLDSIFKSTFYEYTVQNLISDQLSLSIVHSKFESTFYKQAVKYSASDLGLHCLPMPHKMNVMLILTKEIS